MRAFIRIPRPSRGGSATLVLLLAMLTTTSAQAQQADPRLSEEAQPPGWSITPRVTTGTAYDDNVLVEGAGSALPSDLNTNVNPGGSLDYIGRHGSFSASYGGSLQLYRDFSSLNTYDHTVNVSARRQPTRNLLLFAQQSYTRTSTTELPALIGIPFVRLGARVANLRGGLEATVNRHLSIAGSYTFQWISFDTHPVFGTALVGGHAHGGTTGLKYQLTSRSTLTADYDFQYASLASGGRFAIQNGWAGVDYRLTEHSHAYGAFGMAHLTSVDLALGKTSPAWRAGYARQFESAAIDVSYTRSFVPTYGAGPTLSNEELTSNVHVPFGRRTYADGAFSLRRNEPVVPSAQPFNGLSLRSAWIGGTLGYAVQPWLRIEGFYGGTHQTIDRPGGRLDRNRIGVQVVTAKPVRIR